MKKQGNMTPPKVRNSSTTKSKDTEMAETLKKIKTLLLKRTNDFKED
jgi:hypothetical protein